MFGKDVGRRNLSGNTYVHVGRRYLSGNTYIHGFLQNRTDNK